MSIFCVTGVLLRSLPPRLSANYFSIYVALKNVMGLVQSGRSKYRSQELRESVLLPSLRWKLDLVVTIYPSIPGPDTSSRDDREDVSPTAYLHEANSDPASLLEQQDWEEQTNTRLTEALETLDPRSRDIVQRRWLGEKKPTLHELAAEYKVSAERIRQLESNAIKKLKACIPRAATDSPPRVRKVRWSCQPKEKASCLLNSRGLFALR